MIPDAPDGIVMGAKLVDAELATNPPGSPTAGGEPKLPLPSV